MTYFQGSCTWGLSASRPKYWGNLVGQYTWQGSAACLGIKLSNQVEWSNNEAHESSQFSLEVKPTLLRSVHFSLGFQDLSDSKGGATRRTERGKSTRYPNFLTILFFCFVHFLTSYQDLTVAVTVKKLTSQINDPLNPFCYQKKWPSVYKFWINKLGNDKKNHIAARNFKITDPWKSTI